MQIETLHFTAAPAPYPKDCKGCMFDAERVSVCRVACERAKTLDLPDCDDGEGFIYVADKSDPRQLRISEAGE